MLEAFVMQIIHRISINSTPQIRRELAALGWKVGAGDPIASRVVTFEADESHPHWEALKTWIAKRGAGDITSTNFSRDEIGAAAWLQLEPDWHWSYPQPEDEYEALTYDLSEHCEQCGVGRTQKAPFRMRGEPKWGRRSILQLNWVFDEYFVTPEVWTEVFEPFGIRSMPVIDTKGRELKTVLQLVIQQRVGVATEGLDGEDCPQCNRKKHFFVCRGLFPKLTREPSGAVVKTEAHFGSGAAADQAVLVSQKVAAALITRKIRGASFRPVCD